VWRGLTQGVALELKEAMASAKELRELYAELEAQRHGRSWNVEEVALGFVGDVGDLAKLVQAAAGVRRIPDLRSRLAHELADCLWSVLVLADKLDVDLESAFSDTMLQLKNDVRVKLGVRG
jgi:NTP pyrophosphatase (non-canonical NTP hydrolase)